MKTQFKLIVALAVIAFTSAVIALADGPVRRDGILDGWFGDVNGNPLTDPSQPVYDKDGCDPAHPEILTPVPAPDGHQLTWGEYNTAKGRASIKCNKQGTHVVINASGLVPNGLYSVWLLTFDEAGNRIGEGSLGASDGSQNTFTASPDGTAALSVIQLAGSLSEFGTVTECLSDEASFLFAAVYHHNGHTYGPTPGPGSPNDPTFWCAFVEHVFFVFAP